MKSITRHLNVIKSHCLSGCILFFLILLLLTAGCGSKGGGTPPIYDRLSGHAVETVAPSYVDVTFNAMNKDHSPLTGLSAGNLVVTEDGSAVNHSTSEMALYKRTSLPAGKTFSIATVLLIDNSPSQSTNWDKLQEAAEAVVDNLDDQKQQKIAIVSFKLDPNDPTKGYGIPYVVQSLTNNKTALNSAIKNLSPLDVGVDLYGGFLQGLSLWQNDVSPKDSTLQQGYLIAITDGQDSAGIHTLDEIKTARDSNTNNPQQIITTIVGNDSSPSDFKTLNNVSVLSNNGYYVVTNPFPAPAESTNSGLLYRLTQIQKTMLKYEDSFYWLRYKSPLATSAPQTGNHALVLSISKNTNKGTDATYSGTIDTNRFYAGIYNRLWAHMAGSQYPWWVYAAFNDLDLDNNGVTNLTADKLIAQEGHGETLNVIDHASHELVLYNRNSMPTGTTFNLDTVLVLDNSPSQKGNWSAVQDAAKAFIQSVYSINKNALETNQQQIAIVAYSDGVTPAFDGTIYPAGTPVVIQPMIDITTNTQVSTVDDYIDQLNSTTAPTDLYGALMVGLDQWTNGISTDGSEFTQGFLVAITDGNETFYGNFASQVLSKMEAAPNSAANPRNVFILGVNQSAAPTDLSTITNAIDAGKSGQYGYSGFLSVPDTYGYEQGAYTNEIQYTLSTVQAKMQEFANCFYWMQYKTSLTQADAANDPHKLVLSVVNNSNTNADATLESDNILAANLYTGNPGIVLSGDGIQPNNDGTYSITAYINPGDKQVQIDAATAAVYLGGISPQSPTFLWTKNNNNDPVLIEDGNTANPTITVEGTGTYEVNIESTIPGDTTVYHQKLYITVTLRPTPIYNLVSYKLESEFPWYVNAVFEIGDGAGSWRAGLTGNLFNIYEDGSSTPVNPENPQSGQLVFQQAYQHNNLPSPYTYQFKTVLLIDNTTSAYIGNVIDAAEAFIDDALATSSGDSIKGIDGSIQQQIAVVSFDSAGHLITIPFSSDPDTLKSAIENQIPTTGIAFSVDLYDAIIDSLNMLPNIYSPSSTNKQFSQGAVVVMTAGFNSNPQYNAKTVTDVLNARGTDNLAKQIAVVGVGDSLLAPANPDLKDYIANLGEDPNGHYSGDYGYYPVPNPGKAVTGGITALDQQMVQVQQKLFNYANGWYWIKYVTQMGNDNTNHEVRIAVKNNDPVLDPGSNDTCIDDTTFSTGNLGVTGSIYINPEVTPGGVVHEDPNNPGTYILDRPLTYISSTLFNPDDIGSTYSVEAYTFKPQYTGTSEYNWSSSDTNIVDLSSLTSNPTDLLAKGASATPAAITVQDVTPGSQNQSLTFNVTVDSVTLPEGNLLLYYPFTGNALDASSNHYDGTVSNATLSDDRFGNANRAYMFNGTNSYIEISHSLAFGSGQLANLPQMTVCAWIKQSSAQSLTGQSQRIIDFNVSKCWSLYINSGRIYFQTPNSLTTTPAATTYNDNKWHFVCVTYNVSSGLQRIYVDGTEVVSAQATQNLGANGTQYGVIGTSNVIPAAGGQYNPYFNGQIDDVSIFTTILTPAQISALSQMR